MKGKRWIAVALVCLAGVGIGGCSIFTGAPGDVREESETMGEDGLVAVCFLTGNGGKQSDKAHKNGAGIHSAFPGCRTGNESRTDGGWRENCPDDRCPLSGKISYRPGKLLSK